VGGKAMSQGVHGYALINLCSQNSGMAGAIELASTQVINGVLPGKEPTSFC
jgi:hypothetical protein